MTKDLTDPKYQPYIRTFWRAEAREHLVARGIEKPTEEELDQAVPLLRAVSAAEIEAERRAGLA